MHKMDGKKLFILGIDNNPKVWYNKRGAARVLFFGILVEKIFVQIAYWQKAEGVV